MDLLRSAFSLCLIALWMPMTLHHTHKEGRRMVTETPRETEELLAKFQFRPQHTEPLKVQDFRPPRLRQAVRRMMEHRTRTGHKVLFGK